MSHIEFVVDALPPTINSLSRRHWTFRYKAKKEWSELIWHALGVNKIRQVRAWADLRHRVRVEIEAHHKRPYDPDNLHSVAKIPLDALKGLQCLVDDSTRWIDLEVREVIGKELKTVFRLTDLQPVASNGKPTISHGRKHAALS